jgi:hypothetical protein
VPTLFRRRAVIAVGAAAAALVGLAARPANAAAIPGWRISATFPVHGKDAVLTSAAVVGPRDAWAAGPLLTLAGAESGLIIRHWDGRSWTTVALPARIARAWRLSHPVGLLVGASDARHVWIFGGQADGAYLRLTGTRWSLGHLPGSFLAGRDVQINAVAAIGKSNVWALGATDNRGGRFPAFLAKVGSSRSASPPPRASGR